MKIKATVAILTFNSGATLWRALESVKDFAEIIVCDGGSTDGTLAIASAHGCRVIMQETACKNSDGSIRDFSCVRNQCLHSATHEWFLYVDSDEMIDTALRDEIRSITESGSVRHLVYRISPRIIADGKYIEHSSNYPGFQTRFFSKKSGATFTKAVHEKISFDTGTVPVGTLTGHWNYFTSKSDPFWIEKKRRYISMDASKIASQSTLKILLKLVEIFATIAKVFVKSLRNYLFFGLGSSMPVAIEARRVKYLLMLLREIARQHISVKKQMGEGPINAIMYFLKKITYVVTLPYAKLQNSLSRQITTNYIVSFPKSGRTWIRVFLAKYMSSVFNVPIELTPSPLWSFVRRVPRIGFMHAGSQESDASKMAVSLRELTGKRALFVARDPRDVVVSYYFQISKRRVLDASMMSSADAKSFENIGAFIRDERFGIRRIIAFMNLVLKEQGRFSSFRVVRYEDMKRDAPTCFRKIIDFFCLPDDERAIAEAIAYSDFGHMKELERNNMLGSSILKPSDPNDPESFKVRKGNVGGYAEYLSPLDIEYVDNALTELNREYGYNVEPLA